jgi:AcrR family transcriptional regulator
MVQDRAHGLSPAGVIAAAVQMLDDDGVAGFSMRALARRLGRSSMAPYRHIDSREAVLLAAAAAVMADADLPDVSSLAWLERIETLMRHSWETSWRAHPWVVDVIEGDLRAFRGIGLALMEDAFREAGLDEAATLQVLLAQWAFIVGTLRVTIALRGKDSQRLLDPDEDALFENNLRLWLLGLAAHVESGTDRRAPRRR